MSQIIKKIQTLQPGGTAPSSATQANPPKTYGKFVMNGQEEQVTDDLINQFGSWLSSQPRDVQNSLVDIRKKLQSGQDVDFDAHAQELSSNVNLPLKNERQDTRMRRQRSGVGMLFDALTNNQVHKNAVAMDAMSKFKYTKPTPVPIKPTDVKFSRHEVGYNPTEGGKSRAYSTDPANAAAFDRVNRFFDFQEMDEENRKGANLNFTGFNSMALEDMLKHTNRADYEAARGRVMSNTANANDWALLNRFNIWDSTTGGQQVDQGTAPGQPSENLYAKYNLDESRLSNNPHLQLKIGEDNKLQAIMDPNDTRLHFLNDYSPFTKDSEYFGGIAHMGKLYSRQEVLDNPELKGRLKNWQERVSNQNYDDENTNYNFWWGSGSPFSSHNINTHSYDVFNDKLKTLSKDGVSQYLFLNPQFRLSGDAQGIAYFNPDSTQDPITGMRELLYRVYDPSRGTNKDEKSGDYNTYYRTYGNRGDFTKDYEEIYNPEWTEETVPRANVSKYDQYKGQNYSKVRNISTSDGGGYEIHRGASDGNLYIKEGNEYFVIKNPALYKQIVEGTVKPNAKQIEDLYRSHGTPLLRRSSGNYTTPRYNVTGMLSSQWPLNHLFNKKTYNWRQSTPGSEDMGPLRYQFGGALKNVKPVTEWKAAQTQLQDTRDIKKNNATWEDIKSGNLTSADKLELGALMADIGATAFSFVPGANLGAGVVGVGATGAQFAADVQRDGLDWGDVGRGAMNLGLDALTFIPGIGGLAKTGKVVNGLRRTGSTVLKALAATGAINAIEPAKRILNGEKFTMEDLRSVVGGLQGTAALGRSTGQSIKRAKTWRESQNTAIKTTNATSVEGEAVIKGNIKGTQEIVQTNKKGQPTGAPKIEEITKAAELKLTPNERVELNKMTVPQKNDFLSQRIKQEYKIDLSPEQVSTLAKDFNVVRSISAKVKGIGIDRDISKKVKGQKHKSEIGGLKARMQASTGIGGKRAARDFYIESKQGENYIPDWGSKTINKVFNLKQFNPALSNPFRTMPFMQSYLYGNERTPEYKNGGKIIKFQPGGLFNILGNVLNSYDSQGNRTYYRPGGGNNQTIAWFPKGTGSQRVSGNLTPDQMNRLQSGQGLIQMPWEQQTPVTGVPGVPVDTTPTIRKPISNTSNVVSKTIPTQVVQTSVLSTAMPEMQKTGLVGVNPSVTSATNVAPTAVGQSGGQRNWIGKFAKLGQLGLDPDNAMAIGSLAMSLGQNNRQARVMKNAIQKAMGSLESSPSEIYPRFSDYGVNSAYESAAQQQLGVKPATSDYLMSHAIEQDAKNKADQLRLEGRLKTSELFSNYLNQTNDLRRNYAGMRTDVDNRNRQRLAQLNMGVAENEAGRLANNYTSMNNFIMEKRNRLAQDKAKQEGYSNMLLKSKLAQGQQDAYATALQPFQDQFSTLDEKARSQYGNVENWLKATDVATYQRLQNKFNEINEGVLTEYGNQQLDYYNVGSRYPNASGLNNLFNMFTNRPHSMASGGKVTKTKSMNASEHIWINQNKDVADAVKQINKNVLTLFLKATT